MVKGLMTSNTVPLKLLGSHKEKSSNLDSLTVFTQAVKAENIDIK
jgi:hypothetical protein